MNQPSLPDPLQNPQRSNRFRKSRQILLVLLGIFLLFDLFMATRIPNFAERVEWKLSLWQYDIHSRLLPESPDLPTLSSQNVTRNKTPQASLTVTPTQMESPATATAICPPGGCITPTPSPTAAPLPSQFTIPFPPGEYEYEGFNNCGPANLAMMLSYWGWKGDQNIIAAYTKPNIKDKNIMPYEMEDFVTEKTKLGIMVRTGGTLDDLKRLIANGYPPVIEKSILIASNNLGWMGHFLFLTGYDDAKQEFTGQDSVVGPNEKYSYDIILSDWRPFNYHYIIAYPQDREGVVRALLGPNADPDYNIQFTLNQALQETQTLQKPEDAAFAWYNVGTNYLSQLRYVDAAHAYDMAISLGIPWRLIWYETGPYKAYYWSQRYQDVIDLANAALARETELEESWYWRGMARMALGDRTGAISDWRVALVKHAGFAPALVALQQAGVGS